MIGLIINPRSRSIRRDPSLTHRLEQILGPRGMLFAPETPEALEEALQACRDASIHHLAIHGGDGTGHRVVTGLFRVWAGVPKPELMWLHGGTMNTVSKSMGQRGHPTRQLESWLSALDTGARLQRTRRWPLQVNDEQYGFLFGIGIVPRFIEVYEGDGKPSPLKAAAWVTRASLSAFVGGDFARAFFRKIPAQVTTDGQPWTGQAWSILTAGSVAKIGLDFQPFTGCLTNPGHMHVFGTGSSATGFIRDMIPLRLGRPPVHPLARDAVCRTLHIRADEDLTYNLDGDLYHTGTEITVKTTEPLTFVLAPGAKPPRNSLGP